MTKGAKLSAGVAMVGWSRPQISSLVLSQAEPTPQFETNISYIALFLLCGQTQYRVKFDGENLDEKDCGSDFKTPKCGAFHENETVSEDCPGGVESTVNEDDGSVTISLANCTVQDFLVNCGQECFGPGQGGQPDNDPPATGSITFEQCPGSTE